MKPLLWKCLVAFSVIISIVLFSTTTVSASNILSEDGTCYYEVSEDGTAMIVKCLGEDPHLIIPSSVDGYTVTTIRYGFNTNDAVETVTIPETVTTIEKWAFAHSNVQEFQVDENNPSYTSVDGVIFNKQKTVLVRFPRRSPSTYVVPNGVVEIGESAFNGCDKLTYVELPQGLQRIETEAFKGCKSLTNVEIPASVNYFGSHVFNGTKSITKCVIPNGITQIPNGMFFASSIKEIYIPDSVTSFGNEAFSYCTTTIYGSRGSAAEHYVNGTAVNAFAKLSFVATDETTTSATTTKTTTTTKAITKTTLATTTAITKTTSPQQRQHLQLE